ncbi:hypothetical protein AB6A40_008303 [Gnathostoma spinigerum]|uniref:Uncharacterized protein n=1 Tax=Gnathostoma spinigerum TaxID=75299 RepID=A0ABD6ETU2_9BILA
MKIALDIPDYLAGLDAVLGKQKNCKDKLEESLAHAAVLSYDAEGRKKLSNVFKLKPAIRETPDLRQKDLHFFFATIQAYFKVGLEYDEGGFVRFRHLGEACEILQRKDLLGRVFSAISYFANRLEGKLDEIENDYDKFLDSLKKTEIDETEQASRRSWFWLKCNELGLFQSTDYGKGAFGSTAPLGFWIEMCTDVFGDDFQIDKIAKAVEATREYYGVRDEFKVSVLFGSKLVSVNKQIDIK